MESCDICCGIDVGKWSHHAVALRRGSGEVLFDGKVGQEEGAIRGLLLGLQARGSVAVVIDQPGSISSLLLAIAKGLGVEVGFLPSKSMARAIEMYGGDVKTDAHDALILAEVAIGIPKLIRPVWEKSEEQHRLARLMSYDRELAAEATRAANRLHDLLLSIHPGLEALMRGKAVCSRLNLSLLARYGGPVGLSGAGRGRVRRWAGSQKGFGEAALARIDELFDAVRSQTTVIPGTEDVEALIRLEAARLAELIESRKAVADKRDELLESMDEAEILASLPGVGPVTCATIIAEVGDVSRFGSAAKLAAYAGLSPKVRQSGTSVRSVGKPRSGNKRLKRVLVLSAARSIQFCDESRRYYERKREEGKSYRSAVMALARKRVDVIYAMLRDGACYQKKNG